MEKAGKGEIAEIRVHYAGEVVDLAGLGVYVRKDLELLKNEVEAKTEKIEIRCVLPRSFRDAVTLETIFSGTCVFTIPEEIARKYSLID